MNRIARLSVFAVLGLLALALVLSPATSQQLQAQDPQRGTDARGDRTRPQADPAVYPEEEPDTASAHLQIPGALMRPENSANVEWAVFYDHPGCIYAGAGSADTWWNGPIYPPQGATLTSLRVYLYDGSVADSQARFAVLGAYGDMAGNYPGSSYGIDGFGWFDIPIPNVVVDHAAYSYIVWWQPNQLGNTMMICGYRLYYTPAGGMVYIPTVPRNGP